MIKPILFKKVHLLLGLMLLTLAACTKQEKPVQLLFDTDFGGDADDLGALAMLNHFHNNGEAELLGVFCWNAEKYAVSGIDAVNTYYGNPDIPIGLRQTEPHLTDWNHSKVLADNLSHDVTFENAPGATGLYRKILSEADDKSLVLITVGPLGTIKNLIDSKADDYSDLNGLELLTVKLKEVVIMGGNFPESENEWNFDGNMNGVTKYVLERITTPITFIGAEIGDEIRTGEIFNSLPKDSPLYLGFYHFGKYAPWMKQHFKGKIFDNATFDQTAVYYAIRNGVGTHWNRITGGRCVADSIGGNSWIPDATSNHSYLAIKKPIAELEEEFEAYMLGNLNE